MFLGHNLKCLVSVCGRRQNIENECIVYIAQHGVGFISAEIYNSYRPMPRDNMEVSGVLYTVNSDGQVLEAKYIFFKMII